MDLERNKPKPITKEPRPDGLSVEELAALAATRISGDGNPQEGLFRNINRSQAEEVLLDQQIDLAGNTSTSAKQNGSNNPGDNNSHQHASRLAGIGSISEVEFNKRFPKQSIEISNQEVGNATNVNGATNEEILLIEQKYYNYKLVVDLVFHICNNKNPRFIPSDPALKEIKANRDRVDKYFVRKLLSKECDESLVSGLESLVESNPTEFDHYFENVESLKKLINHYVGVKKLRDNPHTANKLSDFFSIDEGTQYTFGDLAGVISTAEGIEEFKKTDWVFMRKVIQSVYTPIIKQAKKVGIISGNNDNPTIPYYISSRLDNDIVTKIKEKLAKRDRGN